MVFYDISGEAEEMKKKTTNKLKRNHKIPYPDFEACVDVIE